MHHPIGPFHVEGTVAAVLVTWPHADTNGSTAVRKLKLVEGHGVQGDSHAGARLLDVRERALLGHGLIKGHPIANGRHVSLVAEEELTQISADMNLPGPIPPGLLYENIVVQGIPQFSLLPPGTILAFRDPKTDVPRTSSIFVTAPNGPCRKPGGRIAEHFSQADIKPASFVKAAFGRRGVVGMVYSSGIVKPGDKIIGYVPKQVPYEPF